MEGGETVGRRHHHHRQVSAASGMKIGCLSFTTSLKETFRYIKATLLGQVKKLRAKNEKEASEADLVASKMQVDAAEEAEETKKRIHKSY
ncbi:hypothetical protein M9H77_32249 [Catharanthus roseus]|uniref:Uncharacterized protein n=1 Tax=Catharanthus roseus TaxID=4058 RepID=A0ACC0A2F0_CATRO|nr:hypothetical protein M9H77_32249 [Catharanthus roseus]